MTAQAGPVESGEARPRGRRTAAQIAADDARTPGLHPVSLDVVVTILEAREHLLAARRVVEHLRDDEARAQAEQYLSWEMRPSQGQRPGARDVAYVDPATGEPVRWTPLATLTARARRGLLTDLLRSRSSRTVGRLLGITHLAVEAAAGTRTATGGTTATTASATSTTTGAPPAAT